MEKHEVLSFFREKKRAAADMESVKKEWLSNVGRLYEQVEEWLAPALVEELLRLERGRISLDEESLGSYEAPTLVMVYGSPPNPDSISFLPYARSVFGAQGRVDIKSKRGVTSLLWKDGAWWIHKDLGAKILWTEERFWEIVKDLQ